MKAVVVIDMPENCRLCPFRQSPWSFCLGEYEKEKHCPLRPLPCKKYMRQMPSDVLEKDKRKRDFIIHKVDVDNSYVEGWNDCIEYLMTGKDADAELNDLLGEILGETE